MEEIKASIRDLQSKFAHGKVWEDYLDKNLEIINEDLDRRETNYLKDTIYYEDFKGVVLRELLDYEKTAQYDPRVAS